MPSHPSSTSIPPHVARYLEGPVDEDRQFDFLIGNWSVHATRLGVGGTILATYQALWAAWHVNEGRMVIDDFKALAPDGRPVSSFVTLRTYSKEARRWEIAGLAAMQAAGSLEWHGRWVGDAMQIEAKGVDPSGQAVQTRIRFSDITPTRFLWSSESSFDDGSTWTQTASLVATRLSDGGSQ